jgi:hypothetical protein
MVRTFLFCALATSAACSFGDDRRGVSADAGTDGPPVYTDHLLLSEIKSDGGFTEFIEIWNPTNRSINLTNYYLSDVGDYWKYPSISPLPANKPKVDSSDFIVRFPAGAMLAPKGVITIAFDSGPFETSYGVAATYALDVTTGPQVMSDRNVPGIVGAVSLTEEGEFVALFYWDGTSDLVKDVDLVNAGPVAGTATGNRYQAKQAQAVDGPDADTMASEYKVENGLFGGGMSLEAKDNTSYKRRTLETGSETQAGTGNGLTGDDETSEALRSSWDGDPAALPSAPTPSTVPNI